MAVAIPIIVILVLAVGTTIVLAGERQRANTGLLSRETKHRDSGGDATPAEASTSTELETTGRERADDTRATYENLPAPRQARRRHGVGAGRRGGARRHAPAVPQPGPGRSRRGSRSPRFGATCLGFLWPTGSSGFGGKISAGKISDILAYIQSHEAPFYIPEARAYVQQYPKEDLPPRRRSTAPSPTRAWKQGWVALYQRCVHLGCRVPWCPSSQWFECPCHGSKYNRVGEKKAGPAPRGLDRFAIVVSGGQMTINTGDIELGPPIGTNTTGQQQEGPLCV